MPEFLRIGSVKFFVYGREESRPHIHVKVWLNELEVARSNASKKVEGKILKLVEIHRDNLLESWNDYFGDNL